MPLLLLLALFSLLPPVELARAAKVSGIPGPSQVALDSEGETWEQGDLVLVYDQDGSPIAALRVNLGTAPRYEAELTHWLAPRQVMPGQRAERIDLTRSSEARGRTELLQRHAPRGKRISSRYKRLLVVNAQNVTGQTAAPLDRGEHYISLASDYSFGITDRLSVGTILLGNATGLYNLRLKYNALDLRTMVLSGAVQHLQKKGFQSTVGTIYLDSIANRDLISHLSVNLAYSRTGAIQDQEFGPVRVSSTIDASTEYILPNWDRLVVGPQYFIGSSSLGGFAQYVFIWDRYHLTLGVSTKDILLLKAASVITMMYWRI